jgi:hypothetical protein
MQLGQVLRSPEELTTTWLSLILRRDVVRFVASSDQSNWSNQHRVVVTFADEATRALRLKVCLGTTFGRSEVDYYTRDYVGLSQAPLVRCWNAMYEEGTGYHLLLDDLSATHRNGRGVLPTLEYGLAVAEALGRLHKHHWCSRPAPEQAALDRYFDEIRPGVAAMEHATGLTFSTRFQDHERAMRTRWARSHGMTLLHGDLNSTNILAPISRDRPVYFLDRQPFDWSLQYGVAVSDLAYMLVLWWPSEVRRVHEEAIFRRWYKTLSAEEYSWNEALADWLLSVEQCLHVPLEWCSKPDTLERMRWLWEMQLGRVKDALERPAGT